MGDQMGAKCLPSDIVLSLIERSVSALESDPDGSPAPEFRERCLAGILREPQRAAWWSLLRLTNHQQRGAMRLPGRLAGIAAGVVLLLGLTVPALAGPEAVLREISGAAQSMLQVIGCATPTPSPPDQEPGRTILVQSPTTTVTAISSPVHQSAEPERPQPTSPELRPSPIPEVEAGQQMKSSSALVEPPAPTPVQLQPAAEDIATRVPEEPEAAPSAPSEATHTATITPSPTASSSPTPQLAEEDDDSQDEAPAVTTPTASVDDQNQDQEPQAGPDDSDEDIVPEPTPAPTAAPSPAPEDSSNQDSDNSHKALPTPSAGDNDDQR